jgi:hypothetical protein
VRQIGFHFQYRRFAGAHQGLNAFQDRAVDRHGRDLGPGDDLAGNHRQPVEHREHPHRRQPIHFQHGFAVHAQQPLLGGDHIHAALYWRPCRKAWPHHQGSQPLPGFILVDVVCIEANGMDRAIEPGYRRQVRKGQYLTLAEPAAPGNPHGFCDHGSDQVIRVVRTFGWSDDDWLHELLSGGFAARTICIIAREAHSGRPL